MLYRYRMLRCRALLVLVLACAHASARAVPLGESEMHPRGSVAMVQRGREEVLPFQRKGWYDPRVLGGQMLDFAWRVYGEPLNVIISGHSDPYVLTEAGLRNYAKSIGFAEECLGIHYGNIHTADLGDGAGPRPEAYLARQHFSWPAWGSCWESLAGGNHFRAWKQNGSLANSSAWFLGVSTEDNGLKSHPISRDGYNRGRDFLVARAAAGSRWAGMRWRADVAWNVDNLLRPGKDGVNHNMTQDGRVAVLTVRRVDDLRRCTCVERVGVLPPRPHWLASMFAFASLPWNIDSPICKNVC